VKAVLLLEDGRAFPGLSAGALSTAFGEVVFNTAMSGYQETLTDPSYRGQIVVMTASHVGNYGLNAEDAESDRLQVSGFAARSFPPEFSSHRGEQAVGEALLASGIPGIDGIDARALVRHLRSRGAMRGAISTDLAEDLPALLAEIRRQPEMTGAALALEVGTREPYRFGGEPAGGPGAGPGLPPRPRIAALDYGIKRNILRKLDARGLDVTVFPAKAVAADLLAAAAPYDGFFLSNGPGDPAALPGCVETIRALLETGKPLFGICLGHQLLGLALGAKTFKLKFGHRGVNHPVKELATGEVSITSQNHGFAVDAATLPAGLEMTHVNLNDGTCEGFRMTGRPVYAVQYHPESAPGPHDSDSLFADFARALGVPGGPGGPGIPVSAGSSAPPRRA
jgi:carbamoyl-phosphate synthase small subunit